MNLGEILKGLGTSYIRHNPHTVTSASRFKRSPRRNHAIITSKLNETHPIHEIYLYIRENHIKTLLVLATREKRNKTPAIQMYLPLKMKGRGNYAKNPSVCKLQTQ